MPFLPASTVCPLAGSLPSPVPSPAVARRRATPRQAFPARLPFTFSMAGAHACSLAGYGTRGGGRLLGSMTDFGCPKGLSQNPMTRALAVRRLWSRKRGPHGAGLPKILVPILSLGHVAGNGWVRPAGLRGVGVLHARPQALTASAWPVVIEGYADAAAARESHQS